MKKEQIEQIHLSLVNGQRKQMAEQITEYGLYNFYEDYDNYLSELYIHAESKHEYFRDAVISYHRIVNR